MRTEIDRMFDEFFSGEPFLARVGEGPRVPSIDIEETDGTVVVRAELPGVKKEDLDIEVTPDALILKAETKQEKEEKGKRYYRKERAWGMFQRMIPLPVEVKSNEAKASLKDGLLEITLPKAAAEKKPEAVKVKAE
jgi:HSP20 family protein